MIRDQIVDVCKSTELRRKFLAAQNLTLEKGHHISCHVPEEFSKCHVLRSHIHVTEELSFGRIY
jgi:hypothetical protein